MSDDNRLLNSSALTRARTFDITPEASERKALAETLSIDGVRKLSFKGDITPSGARDLILKATLGATVVQACVVTGEPVVTRIDEDVVRQYLADMDMPEAEESEMPEDDSAEPMPEVIDLGAVMAEALALALPAWPRADGVAPVDLAVTEPGKTPMSDDDARPFAGLKDLRDSLGDNGSDKE